MATREERIVNQINNRFKPIAGIGGEDFILPNRGGDFDVVNRITSKKNITNNLIIQGLTKGIQFNNEEINGVDGIAVKSSYDSDIPYLMSSTFFLNSGATPDAKLIFIKNQSVGIREAAIALDNTGVLTFRNEDGIFMFRNGTSGSGWGAIQTKYKSSDGSDGYTGTINGVIFKDGICVGQD